MSRRTLLAFGLAATPLLAGWTRVAAEPDLAALRTLVRNGLRHDATGAVTAIFSLEPEVATDVLLPATKADALPDRYAPDDLVGAAAQGIPQAGGQLLRALIVDDTRALIASAAADGVDIYIGSGYRSQAYQSAVFAAQVRRWGDPDTANRYSAQPGHSQHQLGTTIDFTNAFAAFRRGPAAEWLRDNAHRFGFLLPYTLASVSLTGYVDEPWHARWVGAELASQLQSLGYQDWPTLSADDVVALVRAEAGLDT